jgi:hypothetical protein
MRAANVLLPALLLHATATELEGVHHHWWSGEPLVHERESGAHGSGTDSFDSSDQPPPTHRFCASLSKQNLDSDFVLSSKHYLPDKPMLVKAYAGNDARNDNEPDRDADRLLVQLLDPHRCFHIVHWPTDAPGGGLGAKVMSLIKPFQNCLNGRYGKCSVIFQPLTFYAHGCKDEDDFACFFKPLNNCTAYMDDLIGKGKGKVVPKLAKRCTEKSGYPDHNLVHYTPYAHKQECPYSLTPEWRVAWKASFSAHGEWAGTGTSK